MWFNGPSGGPGWAQTDGEAQGVGVLLQRGNNTDCAYSSSADPLMTHSEPRTCRSTTKYPPHSHKHKILREISLCSWCMGSVFGGEHSPKQRGQLLCAAHCRRQKDDETFVLDFFFSWLTSSKIYFFYPFLHLKHEILVLLLDQITSEASTCRSRCF